MAFALVLSAGTTSVIGCDRHIASIEAAPENSQSQNPPGCPDAPTPDMGDGLPCSLATGTVCTYQVSTIHPDGPEDGATGWSAYACGCAEEGVWSYTYQLAEHGPHETCPDVQPETGAPCESGGTEFICTYYPGAVSSCEPSDTWSTWEVHEDWVCADRSPVVHAADTSGVDSAKAIADLSASEVAAWCTWFAGSWPENVSVSVTPSPGVITSLQSVNPGCLHKLTFAECTASLTAQPCGATISALDDCIATLTNDGQRLVGHGCRPFLQTASCVGTIVAETTTVETQTSAHVTCPVLGAP